MGVDQDRQATARERKRAIITALTGAFDLSSDTSQLASFKKLTDEPAPRYVIANADIDGLVSAQMLHAYTGWPTVAVTDSDGAIRVHPDFGTPQHLIDSGKLFGVDTFSPLFPSISNHPVYFGTTNRTPSSVRGHLADYDDFTAAAVDWHKSLNPSAWVGINAMFGSTKPDGIPYKYPLGTAQLLLAVLEATGHGPKLFDRQYLPWLIANCDGGVETIRSYAWNAEMWWGCIAAVVGPSSHSEALFRTVTNQRPNEFLDLDRRLRYDEPERSVFLNTKWNLKNSSDVALATVSGLLTDLSGWPDPFKGGVDKLDAWNSYSTSRGVLPVSGLTKMPEPTLVAHLDAAKRALHVNFSVFKERGTALGWQLPGRDARFDGTGGASLPEEEIAGDEPSVPDADVNAAPELPLQSNGT